MVKLVICFSLAFGTAWGQTDSIALKIERATGVQKAEAYYEAVFRYLLVQTPLAQKYVTESEEFAKKENRPLIWAYAYLNRGIVGAVTGQLDSALISMEKARVIFNDNNQAVPLIKTLSSLGKTYIAAGKPEKAIENLFGALRLLEKNPNLESELKVRINITWGYLEMKRFEDCVRFGRASLPNFTPQYEWMLTYPYNNIAVAYGHLKKIDSVKYFIDKSIPIGVKYNEFGMIANAYFILGNAYKESGKFDLAAEEFQKAKPFREKIGDPLFIVADQYTLSDLYYQTGKYQQGVEEGLKGLQIAQQHNLLLKYEGVYEALAKNYEGLGNFKEANNYHKLWAAIKDSVYKTASTKAIAEMQTRYESEKKQQQIVVQNLQLSEQKSELKSTYLVIAGLVVISSLLGVIFLLARNRFKRKQELMKKENELQLRAVFLQATLQSQEQERKRFAQDLHDSMGQMITALRLLLSNASGSSQSETHAKTDQLLTDMHKEIRAIAFNLMPQTLIQQGLMPALDEMALRINQSGRVNVKVSGYDLPVRLTELQEISLYRILQEWTGNCLKYSGATKLDIQLVRHDNEIVVTAEDDGSGFDPAVLNKSKGNGWKNIQSRIQAIRGYFDLDTQYGRKGTTFTAYIPLT